MFKHGSILNIDGKRPELGVQNNSLTPCPKAPNCACSTVDPQGKSKQLPWQIVGSLKDVMEKVKAATIAEPRSNLISQSKNYLRFECRSSLFGFVDDLEYLFSEVEAGKIKVDFRSAARLGLKDFNVNRLRIDRIRARCGN